jgi:hypothetical protein
VSSEIVFVFCSLSQDRNGKAVHKTLTPWSKVLLEKLIVAQLIKKLPTFHGTRMFITALTKA